MKKEELSDFCSDAKAKAKAKRRAKVTQSPMAKK
jgi:hypothetical protein